MILASGFTRKQPVLYLELLLEGQLGIADGLVMGELAERPAGAGRHYPRESVRFVFPLDSNHPTAPSE